MPSKRVRKEKKDLRRSQRELRMYFKRRPPSIWLSDVPPYTAHLWMQIDAIKFEYSDNQPVVLDADL